VEDWFLGGWRCCARARCAGQMWGVEGRRGALGILVR
jgi:hypothetical protein